MLSPIRYTTETYIPRPLDKYALFLNQTICCGYSKEPSPRDGSFGHPKQMLKLIGKTILAILHSNLLFDAVSSQIHNREIYIYLHLSSLRPQDKSV